MPSKEHSSRQHNQESAPNPNSVLLIHGIWNHAGWLYPLASKLRQQGFEPQLFSYDSILLGAHAALPQLKETIERAKPTYLVGHSLGGLLALEALEDKHTFVKRVACLGAPLKGSTTAKSMSVNPFLRHALGRSEPMLTQGVKNWEGKAEVGMVAGVVRRGLGQFVAPLVGTCDGTVLLEETKLHGLKDHCTVNCGHTELAFVDEAARQVGQFLRTGQFERRRNMDVSTTRELGAQT